MFKIDIIDAHSIIDECTNSIYQDYYHVLLDCGIFDDLSDEEIAEIDSNISEIIISAREQALSNIDSACY